MLTLWGEQECFHHSKFTGRFWNQILLLLSVSQSGRCSGSGGSIFHSAWRNKSFLYVFCASGRRFVFIAAVHRHRDFPSTWNVVFRKRNEWLDIEICQSALSFQLTTAYSYYKQNPFSILGTTSEYKRQCSCAQCTILMVTIPKDSILKPTWFFC